jgi:hypothetical protein
MVLAIFVYCLFIFQQRTEFNVVSIDKWQAQSTAERIARNINTVFLLDDNSTITDYIYFFGSDKNVLIIGKTVVVEYLNGSADAPIVPKNVSWLITDVNGAVYFKKLNGVVVVSYSN